MDVEKDEKAVDETKLKQAKNLFNSLIKDENSIFYSADKINKNLVAKARRSVYAKDKLYTEVENKNYLYLDKNIQPNLPLTMPFIEKRKNIDRSMLYSFKGQFEFFHAGIADVRFLAKSAVDSIYCLLLVDLFTFKIYTYPMKKRSLLKKKWSSFIATYLKKE